MNLYTIYAPYIDAARENFIAFEIYLQSNPLSMYAANVFTLMLLGFVIMDMIAKRKQAAVRNKRSEISAISGEDVMTTQLDLARAYIEMGKIDNAKAAINDVVKNGNSAQKREAKSLRKQL